MSGNPPSFTDQITTSLVQWNEQTAPMGLPLDGVLSFGTMFGMYYMGYRPLPTLITGAIIHGVVHPIVAVPK